MFKYNEYVRSPKIYGSIESRYEILDFESAQEEKSRRLREKKERERKLQEIEDRGYCEGFAGECSNKKDLKWTYSQTNYLWDIDEEPLENPNRPLFFCSSCAEGYMDYWYDMCRDYYASTR